MALAVLAASIVAAVVPTIIYASVLSWFDRYEKEPLRLLLTAFLWGAIPAAILALVTEVIANVPLSLFGAASAKLIGSSAVAPFVEEITKAIFLLVIYLIYRQEFDDPLDGIIYGAMIGFGFAMTENVLYFIGAWSEGGWARWDALVVVRAIVFGLNHAFFTSLTGLGLGLARVSQTTAPRIFFPIAGLLAATFFHAVHNLGITLASANCLTALVSFLSDWGGVGIIFVVIILCGAKEKGWLTAELKEETTSGLITPEQYAMTCSYRARIAAQSKAVTEGKLARAFRLSHYAQCLTELAFKKHQTRTRGEDHSREIARLREQIVSLRSRL